MAPVFSAVVKFSGSKSCFVSLPETCIKSSKFFQDIPVFEVSCGENCSVYLSYKGGKSCSNAARNEIQLSRKYGLMLGLKEGEEVLVQQYEKDVTIAEKVVLEPFSCDDWEILNLNSKTIESSLLDQIRVIWKGQKFPVCAFNSVISVEVAEVAPAVKPVLLAEWTEVHIIPKERSVPPINSFPSTSGGSENKVRSKKYNHLKPRHKENSMSSKDGLLNPDAPETQSSPNLGCSGVNQSENSSVFSIFQSMVKTVFTHSEQPSSSSLSSVAGISSDEAEPAGDPIKLRLRVIPYSRMLNGETLPLALQSTTVFISDQTLTSQCQVTEVPLFFVANLTKLSSPSERFEKIQKSAAQSKSNTKNRHTKEKDDGDKKDTLFSIFCVNVVVIRSFDKEYNLPESLHLPLNYIAVPKELKRCLSLEDTSIVHCESVNYHPIGIDTLLLFPLSAIPPQVREEYVNFKFVHWMNEALQPNASLLVSDGTLVCLEVVKGKFVDFLISFGQQDNQDAPNGNCKSPNYPSTSNSSPDSLLPLAFPEIPRYGYIKGRTASKISVKVAPFSSMLSKATRSVSLNRLINDQQVTVPGLRIEALGGIKSIYEKAMEDLIYWLKLSPIPLMVNDPVLCYGNMLICGPKGVGKSTLAKALCRKLSEFPHYVYTKVLDCRPLRGKRVETILKKWQSAIVEAIHREPSVVLFDDLDQLASAPITPEQEVGPDGIYFSRIAQVFLALVNAIVCQQNRVVIIATSKSNYTLHSSLTLTRGCHTFQSVIDIPPPSISERADILRSLILSKVHLSSDSLEKVSLDELAKTTEGYIAHDLDSLVDKATHAALLRTELNTQDEDHEDEQIILCNDDFEVAMEGYIPSSLRGVQLHCKGNKSWKDIGGLHLVKKLIQQILWWPVKYSKLLSMCPIKPQSNILLYGAPGTGKTLLANVVANECGLNFISIKGPELLSKYIGASEEAVRDLFQRALSAKPCIIFFDEFDAIAPKRGHDSTGVTDRVVNQFLTQMDGVESAQGVYVLAASSRPDLIDPALLRPGRLDKCLNCPLPNEAERLEILSVLSSHLTLGDDVNLDSIANTTKNFSGADLQALLYSSQLEAFHDIQASKRRLSLDPNESGDSVNADLVYMPSLLEGPAIASPLVEKKLVQEVNVIKDNIAGRSAAMMSRSCPRKHSFVSLVIQQKHLDKVQSQMKPSVSEKERQRYQAIYEKFINSHGGDFTPLTTGLKKVTLA